MRHFVPCLVLCFERVQEGEGELSWGLRGDLGRGQHERREGTKGPGVWTELSLQPRPARPMSFTMNRTTMTMKLVVPSPPALAAICHQQYLSLTVTQKSSCPSMVSWAQHDLSMTHSGPWPRNS